PRLKDGGYVLTWRVVSDDGHPVSGGVTFRVGSGAVVQPNVLQRLLDAEGGDTTLHVLAAVVRAVLFGAMLLLVGGALFVLLVWPAGADDARTRRVLWGAAAVGAVTTALSMGIEGADIAGLGAGHAFSISKALDTLDTSVGQAAAARLVLFAVFALLVTQLARRRASVAFTTAVGVVSTALLLTLSLAGHA